MTKYNFTLQFHTNDLPKVFFLQHFGKYDERDPITCYNIVHDLCKLLSLLILRIVAWILILNVKLYFVSLSFIMFSYKFDSNIYIDFAGKMLHFLLNNLIRW